VKSVVVYGSRSGNTRGIAQAIAGALEEYGPVRLVAAEDASATVWDQCDLLLVGSPTEGRNASPPVCAFFDRLPSHALRGIDAASFDTRLAWPRMLSGSAALGIRRKLVDAGANILVDPESFKVSGKPSLFYGELERAPIWARKVAQAAHGAGARQAMAQPALA